MRTTHRLRLGVTLTMLSGLFLAAAILGGVVDWPDIQPVSRVLTVLICLAFSAAVTISVSIVLDHRLREVPWARLGVMALVMLAGCGLILLRREIEW